MTGIYCCPLILTQTCHTLGALFSWVMAVPVMAVLPPLQHLSIWWVYFLSYILWDPAMLCWLLSYFLMVTMEIFASANNCPLSSRSLCFLSWTIKFLWTAFSYGHQKAIHNWWPCSFVIRHWGRSLQNQFLLLILYPVVLYSAFSSGNPPLNAAGPCSAVSSLHPGIHYLSAAKIFSGYLDDCAFISGCPLIGSTMAKVDSFERWKLKVTLSLGF